MLARTDVDLDSGVAFAWKAHSGWAALVVLGGRGGDLRVVDRRRVELVEAASGPCAKQPYHAAENLPAPEARSVVQRGVEAARELAAREMRAAVARAREGGHEISACAILVSATLPAWSVEQILAVHLRMHAAEGALFRDALIGAAESCGLKVVEVLERSLAERAGTTLPATPKRVQQRSLP